MGTRLIAPHSLPGIYSDKIQLESGRIEYFCLSDFRERETNNLIDIFLMSPLEVLNGCPSLGSPTNGKPNRKRIKIWRLFFVNGERENSLENLKPILIHTHSARY
jgi:hypothetical protein